MKYHWSYYWTRLKDKIKYSFVNRQRWLTKKIPRTWRDKDSLIEIVLFECLKNYVEGEIGKEELFNKNRWDLGFPLKQQLKFEKELKIHYNLLTITLSNLENNLNSEWKKISDDGYRQLSNNSITLSSAYRISYNKKYKKVDLLENKINNLKDKLCEWIILNRRSMWV